MSRCQWVLTVVVFVCCGLVFTASRPMAASGRPVVRAELTFSGAFSLPGVTLGPGAYAFELADAQSGLVVVRARRDERVLFLGFTTPGSSAEGAVHPRVPVTLTEAPRGVPPRVLAWYPAGAPDGRRFIY